MRLLKTFILPFLLILPSIPGSAQNTGFGASYHFYTSQDPVQDRDFYFLTLLEKLPPLQHLVSQDQVLAEILSKKKAALQEAPDSCGKGDIACRVTPLLWTGEESRRIDQGLREMLASQRQDLRLLATDMRSSGFFIRYDSLKDLDMVSRAWEDAVLHMNYIIRAYTTNQGLLYPAIDSTTFPVHSAQYKGIIQTLFFMLVHRKDGMTLFFQPSLELSLSLLFVNYRDEAVRFQPLDSTNAGPYQRIPQTDWKKYPYSVILLPGEGPENNMPISPVGKYRCMLGAEQYRKGMAPFIVVSGGFVHPMQTPYCEANEMKKYLVHALGIPADAVILEPHARHTTTNIRNTDRIIFRAHIPGDKPVLCTSDPSQIVYILAPGFARRCVQVMDYAPWTRMKPVNAYSLSFYPLKESLQMDASDPMDP